MTALHRRMLARDVVAICGVKVHARSPERLGAMMAQKEVIDGEDDRHQKEPPGFQIVFLPFADDIRQLTDPYFDREQATSTQIAAASDMVQNAMIPHYDASCFENPELAKHYCCLQALALFKDDTGFFEDDDDCVKPDMEGQKEYTEPAVRTFVSTLPERVEVAKKTASKKRKAEAPPLSEEEAKQMRVDMKEIHSNGTLKKQSVARLKSFLKSQGHAVSGKKAELLERVEKLFA